MESWSRNNGYVVSSAAVVLFRFDCSNADFVPQNLYFQGSEEERKESNGFSDRERHV
jgi:hypothetical protein